MSEEMKESVFEDGKTVAVNIEDATLPDGEVSVLDPTDDPWSYSAPPPKGPYLVKWMLGSNGFSMGRTDPKDIKTTFFSCDMEGRIQSDNSDIEDTVVFFRVSTRLGRGKKLSTMAGTIIKFAGKLPTNESTPKQLVKWLDKCLRAEPVRWCELDWGASYKTVDRNGKESWKNYARTMTDFPRNGDGTYKHQFVIDVGGGRKEEITARLNVVHMYGKDEKPKPQTNSGTGIGATGAKAPPMLVVDALPLPVINEPEDDIENLLLG